MKITIPLLHDNHNHVSLYAVLNQAYDISNKTATEAINFLYSLPEQELSLVKGWKSFELKFDKSTLSSLPPILIINFSLHGFVISDKALPYVAEKVPDLAENRNDQVWCEANVPKIFKAYAGFSGLGDKDLCTYIDSLLHLGIASSDEMTVPDSALLDLCLNSSCRNRISPWLATDIYREIDEPTKKRVNGIKLYLDGAIGSRSAAIKGPWIGEGKAFFVYIDEEVRDLVKEAALYRTGIAIHAIGELAIEQALNAIEETHKSYGMLKLARIEHAQFISMEQARRAKEMGVILSMQANFTSDSVDYADRLPLAYLKANNPFRMLIDDLGFIPGQDLILGSDGMPDGIAYAAKWSLFPPFPSQYLSIDELVAAYGIARAYKANVELDIDEKTETVTCKLSS